MRVSLDYDLLDRARLTPRHRLRKLLHNKPRTMLNLPSPRIVGDPHIDPFAISNPVVNHRVLRPLPQQPRCRTRVVDEGIGIADVVGVNLVDRQVPHPLIPTSTSGLGDGVDLTVVTPDLVSDLQLTCGHERLSGLGPEPMILGGDHLMVINGDGDGLIHMRPRPLDRPRAPLTGLRISGHHLIIRAMSSIGPLKRTGFRSDLLVQGRSEHAAKYTLEFKARALELIEESVGTEKCSGWTACVGEALGGISSHTLRNWWKQSRVGQGQASGVSSQDGEELRRLRGENLELRCANQILKAASAFFAAELGRPTTR